MYANSNKEPKRVSNLLLMTPRTKEYLLRSIPDFKTFSATKKKEVIEGLEYHIKCHYEALNNIGMGYSEDQVKAAEIFLRIFKK